MSTIIKRKPPVAGRVYHRALKRIEQSVFRMIVKMMYELTGVEQCMKASIASIPRAFRAIVSPDIAKEWNDPLAEEYTNYWREEGRPWFSRYLSYLRSKAGGSIHSTVVRNERTKSAQHLHGTPIKYIRPETTHYESPSSYLVFTNGLHHQIVKYSLHMKSDDKPVSTFVCSRTYAEADRQITAETFIYDAEITLTFLSNNQRTTISLPSFLSENLWRKQKQDEKYASYEEYYTKLISQTV